MNDEVHINFGKQIVNIINISLEYNDRQNSIALINNPTSKNLLLLANYFIKLGTIGFGGPVALKKYRIPRGI